ncbi:Gfo/Idh/MocA family protein [Luteimonas salinilitoris]|uniref:Gfo/Idh/MocA family protein n=1 Tax=Luteimonas salinilitoris TaxID=3237697 RepID=A0ABV4HV13_9GAMM
MDRRTFLAGLGAGTAATVFSARSYARILGANDRLRVAVIGLNGRGVAHLHGFAATPNTEVTHLVDVDSAVLEKSAGELAQGQPRPQLERDYRRLLETRAIDVFSIATPDHSHAKIALDGMAAGKHVYLEKPCGIAPNEGEALVAGQKRHDRVLQMGNQQRSSRETQELVALVRAGELGELYAADTWYANNRTSIGRGSEIAPPPNLDWELWQGPRPRRPYRSNLVHYNWHWFWHWGTGEICNNALHEIDIARWLMDVQFPEQVSAKGARRFHRGDDWEMYDTLRLDLSFAGGRRISWDGHSCNGVERYGRGRGVLVYGTKGSALVDRNGFEIFDLAGKSVRKATAKEASGTTDTVGEGALDLLHIGNFADVIRGKAKALASPISEGHISTLLCHLGNMAYRTGADLSCDPANGRPRSEAALAYWTADYQPGWDIKS